MLDLDSQHRLNKAILSTRIIYFAFIVSLIIYLFMPNIIIKLGYGNFEGKVLSEEVDLLKNIIYLLSGLTVVVILILRWFLTKVTKVTTSTVDEMLKGLISGNIVLFALSESLAIYGLVLFSIAGMIREFYLLVGLSFISLLICFPRSSSMGKIVR